MRLSRAPISRLLPALALATAFIAACSGGTTTAEVATLESPEQDTTVTTTQSDTRDAEQAALEFAQCMRDNGAADFPDPATGEKVEFDAESKSAAADEDLEAAYLLCVDLLEGTTFAKDKNTDDSAKQDRLYDFALCMREQGFDMPDPDAADDAFAAVDKTDPTFPTALDECDEIFGAGEGKTPSSGG